MVLEHAAPDERRVHSIEEVANPFERHRQRLECIDSEAVLDLVYPRSFDAEGTLPVIGTLCLPRLAERDHDGTPGSATRVQATFGDRGTEWGDSGTAHLMSWKTEDYNSARGSWWRARQATTVLAPDRQKCARAGRVQAFCG